MLTLYCNMPTRQRVVCEVHNLNLGQTGHQWYGACKTRAVLVLRMLCILACSQGVGRQINQQSQDTNGHKCSTGSPTVRSRQTYGLKQVADRKVRSYLATVLNQALTEKVVVRKVCGKELCNIGNWQYGTCNGIAADLSMPQNETGQTAHNCTPAAQ